MEVRIEYKTIVVENLMINIKNHLTAAAACDILDLTINVKCSRRTQNGGAKWKIRN